jgi:hypothetical protein
VNAVIDFRVSYSRVATQLVACLTVLSSTVIAVGQKPNCSPQEPSGEGRSRRLPCVPGMELADTVC